ncbi:hypothetical protein H4Q26_013880 [Puccinia striiformis f. sp. tritici PST-130]|nr:hypothetical protein H4Q26_013880 [Puccinia striiformis f. sp. tritici PST-130]
MEKYVLPMLPQSTARWLTNITTRQQTQADNNDELVMTMKNSQYSQNQRKNLQRLSYHPSSLLPIQADRSLYINESTTDALLVRCFQIRKEGQKNYSQNCVHHGLSSQYCWKVGWDDVTLFLRKSVPPFLFLLHN